MPFPIKDPLNSVSISEYQDVILGLIKIEVERSSGLINTVCELIASYLLNSKQKLVQHLRVWWQRHLSDSVIESVNIVSPIKQIGPAELRIVHKKHSSHTVLNITARTNESIDGNLNGYVDSGYSCNISMDSILSVYRARLIEYTVKHYGISKEYIKRLSLILD